MREVRVYGHALTQGELLALENFPVRLAQPSWAGDSLSLEVQGYLGANYALQTSSNLVDWTTLYLTNPPAARFRTAVPVEKGMPGFYRVELH
jgi:hypothetical protein